MDDNNTQNLEQEVEKRPEKESSKTFTQSEVDQMIARATQRTKQNFGDYDAIKQEHEALLAEKKERDLANKTEVEKLQAMNSELTTELTNVKGQISTYEKERLRMDVLNGNKYLNLPRAYKNLVVLSEDKEAIIASADEVLQEFENDTGKKVADTFGIAEPKDTTLAQPSKKVETPEDLAASWRSTIMSKLKGRIAS